MLPSSLSSNSCANSSSAVVRSAWRLRSRGVAVAWIGAVAFFAMLLLLSVRYGWQTNVVKGTAQQASAPALRFSNIDAKSAIDANQFAQNLQNNLPGAAAREAATFGMAATKTTGAVNLAFARLPLRFEEVAQNAGGQAEEFTAAGGGYRLALKHTESQLELMPIARSANPAPLSLRMKLLNANPGVALKGEDQVASRVFYFEGNKPAQWKKNISVYSRVRYQDAYPGIDVVYYGNNDQLEYDFQVAPGADPRVIRLQLESKKAPHIDAEGNLVLSERNGKLLLQRPLLYQVSNGQKTEVAGGFTVQGHQIGFAVGSYDKSLPLIIDPILNYATYVGRSINDKVNAIAVGPDGSTYVTGVAAAASSAGKAEAFVAHLSANGKVLDYITYLGGADDTDARGIAVDASGNVYITGQTKAIDFPVRNAMQPTCHVDAQAKCAGDAYLVKLAADGSLDFATYLGGSGVDAGNAIALDTAGDIYVAGYTESADFPVLRAPQGTSSGKGDAFVAKVSGDGLHILFATYLGGTGRDEALGLAVDKAGDMFVAGTTKSVDFPTENAFQKNCASLSSGACLGQAFVTKIAADGSAFSYSTYLGGSAADSATAIAVDASGQAYVAGTASSKDFPVLNAYQKVAAGGTKAFVAKLSVDGGSLLYSTYLGGSKTEVANGIAVDARGSAYVSGQTNSPDFPISQAVQSACQKTSSGACSEDAFVTVLNPGGSTVRFSSYLGGKGTDEGRGIAIDGKGSAFVGGATTSVDFPMAARPAAAATATSVSGTAQATPASSGSAAPLGGGVVAMLTGMGGDPQLACSGTINWTGTAGDNLWTTASNWDKNALPGSSDDVCIGTAFATTTIVLNTSLPAANQTIASLVSNANLDFQGATLISTGAATFVNALSMESGTLTLNGASSVGTTLTQSSGIISGTGALTITGLFTWTGGYLCTTLPCTSQTGTPANTYANGGMTLTSGYQYLLGRNLNTTGTVTASSGGYFYIGEGAAVTNLAAGTWNFSKTTTVSVYSGAATFNNQGTFTNADNTEDTITVPFNNSGSVQAAAAGTLQFSAVVDSTGSWSAASGSTLYVDAGSGNTATFSGAFSGAGTVYFGYNGGTDSITGTYGVTGLTQISSGTAKFVTGKPVTLGAVTISGGILAGTDNLTMTGVLTWTGGYLCTTTPCTSQTGTPANTYANGGVSMPSGYQYLLGRNLNTTGTVSASSGGYLYLGYGATVTNPAAGTWNLSKTTYVALYSGTGTFNNQGTFALTDSSQSDVTVTFNNTGSVQAGGGGTLEFSAVGSSSGSWSATSGSTLYVDAGSSNTAALSGAFSGAGTMVFGNNGGTDNITGTYNVTGGTKIAGGTVNFAAPVTLTSVGPLTLSSGTTNFTSGKAVTFPSVSQTSGTLAGTDNFTITGLYTWTGGYLCTTLPCTSQTGTPANTAANGGLSIPSGYQYLLGRNLNTTGTVSASSAGYFYMGSGATVTNPVGGTWNLSKATYVAIYSGAGTFNNQGTFALTDSNQSNVTVTFNNTGSVQAGSSGTLDFSAVGTSTGSWSVTSGSTLFLDSGSGNTAALSGPISGAGTVILGYNSGTDNITGTYNVTGATKIQGGTVNFAAPVTLTSTGPLTVSAGVANFTTGKAITFPSVTESGGTLSGTDDFTITGLYTWTSGYLCTTLPCTSQTGTPANTYANGGLSFPSGYQYLLGRNLNTTGTVAASSGGYFYIGYGATVTNPVGGTWNLSKATSIALYSGSATFNNQGTLAITDGTQCGIGGTFNNTGTVNPGAGNLVINGAYTQTAGTTLVGSGTGTYGSIFDQNSPLAINGGTMTGSGIVGYFGITNNGGTLAPGTATTVGAISLPNATTGSYSQSATSSYNVKLAGTATGQYDTISATKSATLAGTLNVSLINGFTPAVGNSFTILSAGSVSGTFTTTNLPTLGSGLGWKVTYNATSVVLSVTSVSSPVATLPVTSLSFPNTIVNTSSAVNTTATLENTGTAALAIASIVPTGVDAANYKYTTDPTHPCPISPSTLGAGSSCTLDVTFTPTSAGAHNSAQITITDNSGNVTGSTQTISLSGTGIQLQSIAITPAPTYNLPQGATLQYSALGTYSDSSTKDLTTIATWNSSAAFATIGATGIATGVSPGTTNITAQYQGVTSNSSALTVTQATHFVVIAPGTATAGTSFNFTVYAEDAGNNVVPGYSGTVQFSSSDLQASLPASSKLTSGVGTFSATLKTAGSQTITATDTVTKSITGTSNGISVSNGAPASVIVSNGSGQSAVINTAFASALSALVRDSGNNPLSGITVTFTAPASGASGTFTGGLTTVTAQTAANGLATAPAFTANATPGSYNVTASVTGVATPASFSLTNTQAQPSTITATSGTPQTTTISTAFSSALVATVKDGSGNPVNNASVTFTAPGTGASGTFSNGSTTITANTNSSGVVSETFTANSTAGGPYNVTASVTGVVTPATFVLTNSAGKPASITATSGTPQSAPVNTAFASLLTATVKDSGGNLLSGITVTFTAPASGASGTFSGGLSSVTAVTNASGVASSATFTANGTAGGYTVTATVSGVATAADFSLTNTVGAPSSITATSGTPQTVAIDTAFASLVATVKDSGGNALSGITVTFTAPTTGASGTFTGGLTTVTATTAANGQATAPTFTANGSTGTYTVTASVAGVATPANFSLTNTVGKPASMTANAGTTPQSTKINTAFTPLGVTVKDAGSNPVSGVNVTFTAPGTGASGVFSNSTATITVATNASGVAAAAFTANGTAGGPYNVTASASGLTSVSFSLTNTAGSPGSITATSGTPQSVAIDTAFAALVATVKDSGGNALSGITVTFTAPASGASGTFSGGLTTVTATTAANGQATAPTFTANGSTGTYTVTASAAGVATPASFSLTNTVGAPASMTANAGTTPQSTKINTAFTPLGVTVKDAGSNPVSGVNVTFTAPGTGASGVFSNSTATITVATNASGVATAAFTANGTAGGPYNVTASATGLSSVNFSLTNTAGAPGSITATSGTPQSVAIDTAFAALVATVKDSGGNALSGITVTFTAPASGASGTFSGGLTTVTATTAANGQATAPTFTANGTTGSYTVTASAPGVATPASFSLTNTVGAPASMTANAGTTPQSTKINTAFTPLGVTVKDAGSNPVSGVNVTFTAPGTGASGVFGNSTATITVATNASGVASAPFTANGTAGGPYNVTASATGLSSVNFSLTNTAGAPGSITATSGTPQSVAIDTAFAALVATVKDSGGNALSGITVTFTAPASGASGTFAGGLTTVTATTAANGQATAPTFTANGTTGSYTVTASAPGVSTPASFSLTNTIGKPASMTTNAGTTPQSTKINTAFTPLGVTVKDAGSNPVSGVNVTFTAPGTGASGTFSNSTATITVATNASGVASAPFTANGTAGGPYNVTASATGLSSVNFSLTNTAGSPGSITATSGTPQSVAIDTAFAALVATVKDSGGNALSGITVTFTAPASGASGTFAGGLTTVTATTAANGQATAPTFTANGTTGSYTVTASAPGVSTPASFSLTNTPAGEPQITATTADSGTLNGDYYVDVLVTNTGTGVAKNVTISTVTLKTLSGTGTVTLISPALPDNLGNLNVGASTTVRLFLNAPAGVTRFLMTETGSTGDASGSTFAFSSAQVVTP